MSAIYKNGIAYGGAASAANLISATGGDGTATNVQAQLDTINENITSLNDDLTNFITITHGTVDNIQWFKIGNVVTIRFMSKVLTETNQWVTIGILPDECRPKLTIPFVCYDNAANSTTTPMMLDSLITTEGGVGVYPFRTGVQPYGTITYIV